MWVSSVDHFFKVTPEKESGYLKSGDLEGHKSLKIRWSLKKVMITYDMWYALDEGSNRVHLLEEVKWTEWLWYFSIHHHELTPQRSWGSPHADEIESTILQAFVDTRTLDGRKVDFYHSKSNCFGCLPTHYHATMLRQWRKLSSGSFNFPWWMPNTICNTAITLNFLFSVHGPHEYNIAAGLILLKPYGTQTRYSTCDAGFLRPFLRDCCNQLAPFVICTYSLMKTVMK